MAKKDRGFAAMKKKDPDKLRRISSDGGRASGMRRSNRNQE